MMAWGQLGSMMATRSPGLVERNALYLGDGRRPFRPCSGGKSIASKRDWSGILELFRPTVFEWDPSGAHQRDADSSGVLGGPLFFLFGGGCEGETGCLFFLCRPPGFSRDASGAGNCNSYGENSNNRLFTEVFQNIRNCGGLWFLYGRIRDIPRQPNIPGYGGFPFPGGRNWTPRTAKNHARPDTRTA